MTNSTKNLNDWLSMGLGSY